MEGLQITPTHPAEPQFPRSCSGSPGAGRGHRAFPAPLPRPVLSTLRSPPPHPSRARYLLRPGLRAAQHGGREGLAQHPRAPPHLQGTSTLSSGPPTPHRPPCKAARHPLAVPLRPPQPLGAPGGAAVPTPERSDQAPHDPPGAPTDPPGAPHSAGIPGVAGGSPCAALNPPALGSSVTPGAGKLPFPGVVGVPWGGSGRPHTSAGRRACGYSRARERRGTLRRRTW